MNKVLIIFSISFLCACAGSVKPTFEGESHTNTVLKNDVLSNALLLTTANGCSKIDKVTTSVVSPPSGEQGKEKVEENWVLFGCDKSFPFAVTLTGDGSGGAYIGVERKF